MTREIKKILLYGWFGEGNLGDELILDAAIKVTREAYPKASIRVMGTKPDKIKGRHGHSFDLVSTYLDHRPRIIARSFKYGFVRAVRNLFTADLVIMASGGAISDWNKNSTVTLFDLIGFFSKRRVPILLLDVGAGPITKESSFGKFRSVLSQVGFILCRDKNSEEELKKIGLGNTVLSKDVVFELHRESIPDIKRFADKVQKIGMVIAPVCLETPDVYELYRRRLAETAKLLSTRYEVSLIPFQREYDDGLVRELRDLCPEVGVLDDSDNSERILDHLEEQDLIIGLRYHSMLEALALGKYVIPIIYHPKCQSLCEDFGLMEYASYVGNGNNWPESNIDPKKILHDVERIQMDDEYADRVRNAFDKKLSCRTEVEYLRRLNSANDSS
ncbi:MAG: hypothetical protein HFJ74_08080 [Eggerthellaceae bacterium]|jgi:polysaccharide pyruvyl transferase WcaK-like protein|nr:hypothetical protein [Eggerthellaceae bacterium]